MIFNFFRKSRPYNRGLALSGGAARGIAHLGVVKALYERGIRPDIIAGTSIGAIAGALLADGHEPDDLFDTFMGKNMVSFMGLAFGKSGILKMKGIEELLEKRLTAKTFEELKTPLIVTSANLNSGRAQYFSKGSIIDKVVASASIPGIFTPVKIDDQLYADGGILDNLPVKPLKPVCNNIIGVHVNYTGPVDEISGAMAIVERSFHLAVGSDIAKSAKACDLFFEPDELKNYGLMDIARGKEMYEIGYNYAVKVLDN